MAIMAAAEATIAKDIANALDRARELFLTEKRDMCARQRKVYARLVESKDKKLEKASAKDKARFKKGVARRQ